MTTAPERELKLGVDADFVLPDLEDVSRGVLTSEHGIEHLEATYWDTANHDLARSGFGLRWRSNDGWTLKAPPRDVDAVVLERDETVMPGESAEPPAELRKRVGHLAAARALAPSVTLRCRRHLVVVHTPNGGTLAEVAHDAVQVLRGSGVAGEFAEVEVEFVGADPDDARLVWVVARLRAAGAHPTPRRSKYVEALRMIGVSL